MKRRRPTYGIGPNWDHPGTQTIYADVGYGWKQPVCGRFSDAENIKRLATLRNAGFEVARLTAKDLKRRA